MRHRSRWVMTAAALTVSGPLVVTATSPAQAAASTPPGAPAPTSTSAATSTSTSAGCPPATGQRYVDTPATYPRTVALTFDDGPNPTWTPQILAVLAKHHVHATFFVIGRRAVTNPEVLQQVVDAGHVIGNHTWHHPTKGEGMYALTEAELTTEFDPATALIEDATGRPVCFFRAPQGKDQSPLIHRVAREHGQTVTAYHTASDYLQPERLDPAWVTQIEQRLENQGDHPILLLHDGGDFRGNTVAALDSLITWYAERGYVFTDPAGRPFPGELPRGATVPATGWAVRPDWTAPDGGTGSLPGPADLPGVPATGPGTPSSGTTGDPTTTGTPGASSGAAPGGTQGGAARDGGRLARLAANSDRDPLAARQVTAAVVRYLMVFSAPPA